MKTVRLILLILPWILVVVLLTYTKFTDSNDQPVQTVTSTAVLNEIEALGKLELVRYNFKEITEVKELSRKYLQIFQLGPDSKIALISEGQAVGCVDLTKLSQRDITIENDSIFVRLPEPELCYYKLDMDKTTIYSLETNPLIDEKAFIEKAYKNAEKEIKEAALNSGILQQTRDNAQLMLKPLLEQFTGKKVFFVEEPRPEKIRIE